MMSRHRIIAFFVILIVFIGSFVFLFYDVIGQDAPKPFSQISVIVRGDVSGRWSIIKQGIDQTASEMRAEVSFVMLTEQNSVEEQQYLLDREIENGAQGIIIAAADSKKMVEGIEKAAQSVPVVAIESSVDTDKISAYFSADNNQMGYDLGDSIVYTGVFNKKIAVLVSSPYCNHVKQRQKGLMDSLSRFDNTVVFWNLPEDPAAAATFLKEKFSTEDVDAVAALETSALEMVAEVSDKVPDNQIDVFGIGGSTAIASYIEKGIIHTAVVQNDFNIGYLGIQTISDILNKREPKTDMTIDYKVISQNNMYLSENQWLLFPFVR